MVRSDSDGQSHERSFRNPVRQSHHCWLARQRPNYRPAAADYGFSTTGQTIDRKGQVVALVKSGALVRLRVTLIGVERKTDGWMILKTGNTLEIEGSDKPALIAESLALVVPKKAAKSEA